MNFPAKRFGRWIEMAVVTVALFGIWSAVAMGQNLIRSVESGHTQSSAPTAEAPVVTPQLAADMLVARQQYTTAIAAFQKIQPQTAYTYNKIGIAYQHLAMQEEDKANSYDAMWLEDEAKMNYRKAIKMDKRYAPAYNNLGTVYYHENDVKLAGHFYRRAIRLDPKAASFWSNLGAVSLARKEYREAGEDYQRALLLNPNIFQELELDGIKQHESSHDLALMYLCFAEVYAQAGIKVEAMEYLRKAFLEGLKDRQKVEQDVQLASLRGTPEFQRMVAPDTSR